MGCSSSCLKTEEGLLAIKGGRVTEEVSNNNNKGDNSGKENVEEVKKEDNNPNKNAQESSEIYDINFESEYLFFHCPKCEKSPRLSFDSDYPEKICIRCDSCDSSLMLFLSDYVYNASSKNLLETSKCYTHNTFLDKFCFECHMEYCSQCETKNIHSDHIVKSIKKIFTSEKIENIKALIDDYKNKVKNYINSFLKEKINEYPKNKHDYIKNNLIKEYVKDMEIFFKFSENILSNYDVEYPRFYQQLNLKTFVDYLKEDVSLKEFDEPSEQEDDDESRVRRQCQGWCRYFGRINF